MNAVQKNYEYKSRLLTNIKQLDSYEYFKYIEQIRKRPNHYSISTERNVIRKVIYEPYKDPDVIEANRRHKLNIYNIFKEPALPKLNSMYLELREKLKNNKDKCREIAEKDLSYENMKFQDRIFNQKPRIEEDCLFRKIPKIKIVNKKDSDSESRKTLRKSEKLRLPSINRHKEGKYEKLFQTEINPIRDEYDNSNNNEQYVENADNMNDHKYNEISHQKQGHLNG